MAQYPDAMLQALSAEELGVTQSGTGNPTESALAAGVTTGVGAIVPVIPFMFTTGTVAIVAAAIVSLVAHFLVGAAKSLLTLRSWWSSGLEMTLAGLLVGGATYLVGLVLQREAVGRPSPGDPVSDAISFRPLLSRWPGGTRRPSADRGP